MGYYTTFELRVQNKEQDTPENVQAIQDAIIEQESDNRHVFDNDGQSVWSDGGIKWYEYTEHLIEISKKLPNLVIQVDGEDLSVLIHGEIDLPWVIVNLAGCEGER